MKQYYVSGGKFVRSLLARSDGFKDAAITDDLFTADFAVFQLQPDGGLTDRQFGELMIAKEAGLDVAYISLTPEEQLKAELAERENEEEVEIADE